MKITARRLMTGAALTAAAALALTACAGGDPSDGGSTSARDYSELTLAASTEPTTWNPADQLSAFDGVWRWQAVYDTLLTCNPDGTVGPGAAESYEFTDDNTVLTMTLRDGMTFENGDPVDAQAVEASIQNMQDGGGADAGRVAGLSIDTPDDHTVVLTSPEPRGLLPVYMCLSTGIVASPAALSSADADSVPVSSGPYTLNAAESTAGSVYTFDKRDDYWNAEAYPYEQLVVNIMPDVTARLNALKTGQVDAAAINSATAAEAEASGLSLSERVNVTDGLVIFDRDGTLVPALGDARVRQAINMVFDRDAIATGLYQSRATPTEQIFGPQTDAWSAGLDGTYSYDLDGARALMAEAGYADGFDVEIPSRSPQTDQANPLIVQQLGELNIRVTEVPLAGPTAVPEILSARFPMTFISMPTSSGLWDTAQSISPSATWNVFHVETPELTALTTEAQTLQGDALAEVVQQINTYTVDNAWFAPWVSPTAYFATADAESLLSSGDPFTKVPRLQDFH